MKVEKKQQLLPVKDCEYCNEPFRMKTTRQKYCTPQHKMAAFYEKVCWVGTCPNCNEKIRVLQRDNEALNRSKPRKTFVK